MFDRASNRKKFHDLTNAEWYEKKLKSKDCDGDDCDDLTEVSWGTEVVINMPGFFSSIWPVTPGPFAQLGEIFWP